MREKTDSYREVHAARVAAFSEQRTLLIVKPSRRSAASVNEFLNLRGDVDEPASIRYFEPKMFSERFISGEVDS